MVGGLPALERPPCSMCTDTRDAPSLLNTHTWVPAYRKSLPEAQGTGWAQGSWPGGLHPQVQPETQEFMARDTPATHPAILKNSGEDRVPAAQCDLTPRG